MSATGRVQLLQGTLDMLILHTLLPGPAHGYGIVQSIQCASEDMLCVDHGSLYPALHRLLRQGWISWEWGVTGNNRKAKFYRLTESGRQQLRVEADRWEKLSRAIRQVMRLAEN